MDMIIYDMTGKMISARKIPVDSDNFQYKYDAEALNNGIYFIYISSLENDVTCKSVLQIRK